MVLSDMPAPLKAFLLATQQRDSNQLLSLFATDAVLIDSNREYRGDELWEWNETVYIGANAIVHPIHIAERDDSFVLAVTVTGDYAVYGVTEPCQFEWHVQITGDRIKSIRMVEVNFDLPVAITKFIMAMNTFDGEALFATFAENALVNDAQREHIGGEAIRNWLGKELIGDRVTMYVTKTQAHQGGYAVIAQVTGDYDKTGLPDPLELRFYFTLSAGLISQLIIIPSKRS